MKMTERNRIIEKNHTTGLRFMTGDLFLVVVALFLVITINVMDVNAERCREIMANPTMMQAAGLALLDTVAEMPGTDVILEMEERRAADARGERLKFLAAQEKRVAKAKEEALIRERYEKALAEAEANSARTWGRAWSGAVLSRGRGSIIGPSGKETYYNLNMSGVVRIMRAMGFSEELYPYEVRDDGVKTLGGYVMVAAHLGIRPRGTFIMTSRGIGLVCDTGGFARRNPTQLDLAVTW